MGSLLSELWQFMRVRKKWWLGPIFVTLFLLSAFVGGVITGLAGFAMGLVVSGVWLHMAQ